METRVQTVAAVAHALAASVSALTPRHVRVSRVAPAPPFSASVPEPGTDVFTTVLRLTEAGPGGSDVDVSADAPPADPRSIAVSFVVDDAPVTVFADGDARRWEVARQLASALADEVHELPPPAWAQPFPPCPGHRHPMELAEGGWRCPRAPGPIIAPIALDRP